jgi:hypothetical protein
MGAFGAVITQRVAFAAIFPIPVYCGITVPHYLFKVNAPDAASDRSFRMAQ